MNKTKLYWSIMILLLVISVSTGCTKGSNAENEDTVKEYSFHFDGVEGDVTFQLNYGRGRIAFLSVKNNTKYVLALGEPVLLYLRSNGGKWQTLYTSAAGTLTVAGIERTIERGAERDVPILPDYELKAGTYMIDISEMFLEIIEAGKDSSVVGPTERSGQLVFTVP